MRKFYVRVYYMSQGGEVLCFDAGPMLETDATALRSVRTTPGPHGVLDAEILPKDADARIKQVPKHNARRIALPSQQRLDTSPD